MDEDDVTLLKNAIFSIFISEKKRASEAMADLEAAHPNHALLGELLQSVRASQAGRQGRAAEPVRNPSAGESS